MLETHNKVRLLSHENIEGLKNKIEESKGNFLLITATVNLKRLRLIQGKKMNINFVKYRHINNESSEIPCDDFNLCTFEDFKEYLRFLIHKEGKYISTLDQKIILYELIKNFYFSKTSDECHIYHSLLNELFELYQFLIFREVTKIPQSILSNIKDKYPSFFITFLNFLINFWMN